MKNTNKITLQDLVDNFYQESNNKAISCDEAQQMLNTIKDSNDLYVKFDLINQLFNRYEKILNFKLDLIKFDYILNLLRAINNEKYVKILDNKPQITNLGKSILQPLFNNALKKLQ